MAALAVLALTPAALDTARRLAQALPGAELHGLKTRVPEGLPFEDTAGHIRALFEAGTAIVGVCAAGILIRALAPLLTDKRAEPPVLAVAVDGASVVPLLGGHHGANELAREAAGILGSHAAITTAGDRRLGLALDVPPPGWHLANPSAAKAVTAALLARQPVALRLEAGSADWLARLPLVAEAPLSIRITDRAVSEPGPDLVFHPPVLTLGVGCERGTPAEELITLARVTLAEAGLAAGAVACVASLDLKEDEPAVHALARDLGVPARFFPPVVLEAEAGRLATPSEVVFQETGCHGVAEGAALAAIGAEATLLVPKRKSRRATCAVARAPHPFEPAGQARGRLFVVGIGPGAGIWRTPEATRALAEATDLVGYGLYLDLLGPVAAGKRRHESHLGAEHDRVRIALDLAAEGKEVALVCSGDAGIYALATLVFELIEQENRPAWNRLDVAVMPGISALQAAAARAGAPINHDFCTISLSDLLTPWPVIERRLKAAAEGDFVVAFYNPVSRKRRDQLARARDLLLTGRPAATPVILARNLGREGETVEVITLGELTPDHADMLTLVMVGNSESRVITQAGRRWVYTPRGYAGKIFG
ncbi:MAG: precorrin-3B C(17)-methyltransferase [Rhodospirillales bacterium]|nr:precorrin-3B C(17)-methyltransferase [Rhodospirillales bacterium]